MRHPDAYAALLAAATKVHALHVWTGTFDANPDSPEDETLWSLICNSLAAADFFFGQAVKREILLQEGEARYQAAQGSLFDDPKSTAGMREAIAHFLESHLGEESSWGDYPDESATIDRDVDSIAAQWARVEPERGLPPSEVLDRYPHNQRPAGPEMGWCREDRAAALHWCEEAIAGRSAPKPECIAVRYLEDMDMETVDGRLELLNSLLGIEVEDVHPEGDDLHPDSWSEDLWNDVMDWARSAHRWKRGEEIDVPLMPEIFQPGKYSIKAIVKFFEDGNVAEAGIHQLAVMLEDQRIQTFGLGLIIEAMLTVGAIEDSGTGLARADRPMPHSGYIEAMALNIGSCVDPYTDLTPPEHLFDDDEGDELVGTSDNEDDDTASMTIEDLPKDGRRVVRSILSGNRPGLSGQGRLPTQESSDALKRIGLELVEDEIDDEQRFVRPADPVAFRVRADELGFDVSEYVPAKPVADPHRDDIDAFAGVDASEGVKV